MSAAERNKGAYYERKAVNWLRENGHPYSRRYLAGDGRQPGDLDAIAGVTIDVKARRVLAIPEWLRQVEEEAGSRVPLLWVHRPGLADVGDWWCISRVRHVVPLLGGGAVRKLRLLVVELLGTCGIAVVFALVGLLLPEEEHAS